jgi:hypothetical protein
MIRGLCRDSFPPQDVLHRLIAISEGLIVSPKLNHDPPIPIPKASPTATAWDAMRRMRESIKR